MTLRIQPDDGISIAFDAKRAGTQVRTMTVQADFSYQASFGSKGPVAYETLLLDSMCGDATLFTRRDEVEAEWRIITPIEEAWAQVAELADLVARGELEVPIAGVFALDDVRDAYRELELLHTRGKLVLRP